MLQNKPTIASHSLKDSTKVQKIAAALYLVTAHLSDSDPVKTTLRTHAMTLLGTTTSTSDSRATVAARINEVLGVAVLARLISEKNASIITLELRHAVALSESSYDEVTHELEMQFGHTDTRGERAGSVLRAPFGPMSDNRSLGAFGPAKRTGTSRTSLGHSDSYTLSQSSSTVTKPAIKTERQQQILSFINERKSAGIKDIALLFPETSEKTIQRELGALVADGRITKRGQKRWSVYMAI